MRALLVVLAVLVVWLQWRLWAGDGGLREVRRLQEAVSAQQAENERLRERNIALEAEIRSLREGLDAVEERARRDFGMIRKGETFYQIIDGPEQ